MILKRKKKKHFNMHAYTRMKNIQLEKKKPIHNEY